MRQRQIVSDRLGLDPVRPGRDRIAWARRRAMGPQVGLCTGKSGVSVGPTAELILIPADEFESQQHDDWLVEGVVSAASIVAVSGPPGCCKTFAMLDRSLSLASGGGWAGQPATVVPTVYVIAEASHQFHRRISAWKRHLSGAIGGLSCWATRFSSSTCIT